MSRRSAVVAVGLAALTLAASRLRRVEVTGDSMRPALEPGDRLLLIPARSLMVGDVVAVEDPDAPERLLMRRVAEVLDDGREVVLVGDAPAAGGSGSRIGPIPRDRIRGRAVLRYFPPERAGAPPRPLELSSGS